MSETTLDQVLSQRLDTNKDIVNVDIPMVKLVIFELGNQCFAFYSAHIREILAQAEVFFLPGCPASLEGVINVRGDIESVMRPHEMLHLADSGVARSSSILLGVGAGMRSGIRVDRIVDVTDVPQNSIQPPPATLPEHMRALVLGVLNFQAQPVTVLDLDKMFSDYARGLG
ncbi:MAG: chemotaxis protein CheW [Burkholderiaceae bacterium]|nr:chemotaxis protein CheW [Burkholderiaceae bacterium]